MFETNKCTFYAGRQIGRAAEETSETHDFIGPMEQALSNIVTVVETAGGRVENIIRLTWFAMLEHTTWGCGSGLSALVGREANALAAISEAIEYAKVIGARGPRDGWKCARGSDACDLR